MAEIINLQDPEPDRIGRIESTLISHGQLRNYSGIGHSLAKFQSMPRGWEEVDGYTETFEHDHTQITRFFVGPWGQRLQFIAWAVGYSYLQKSQADPIFGILRREVPVQDVEVPWAYCVAAETVKGLGAWRLNPHLIARDRDGQGILTGQLLDIDGFPIPGTGRLIRLPKIAYFDKSSGSDYKSAMVKLTFQNLQYEVRSDAETDALGLGELTRYVYREPMFNTEAIPYAKDVLKFTQGPTGDFVDTNAARLIIPKNGWRYHWFDAVSLPTEAWKACVGKVNEFDFDGAASGSVVHPAETLLCMSPVPTRYRTPAGSVGWKITYTFLVSPSEKGWNSFISMSTAGQGKYWLASINGGNDKAFAVADFDQLFTQPYVTYQS